jgi:hypothetical protein
MLFEKAERSYAAGTCVGAGNGFDTFGEAFKQLSFFMDRGSTISSVVPGIRERTQKRGEPVAEKPRPETPRLTREEVETQLRELPQDTPIFQLPDDILGATGWRYRFFDRAVTVGQALECDAVWLRQSEASGAIVSIMLEVGFALSDHPGGELGQALDKLLVEQVAVNKIFGFARNRALVEFGPGGMMSVQSGSSGWSLAPDDVHRAALGYLADPLLVSRSREAVERFSPEFKQAGVAGNLDALHCLLKENNPDKKDVCLELAARTVVLGVVSYWDSVAERKALLGKYPHLRLPWGE